MQYTEPTLTLIEAFSAFFSNLATSSLKYVSSVSNPNGKQMKNMVEIEIVLDEQYADPHVTIRTKSNTQQVENIICAIEDASNADYP